MCRPIETSEQKVCAEDLLIWIHPDGVAAAAPDVDEALNP